MFSQITQNVRDNYIKDFDFVDDNEENPAAVGDPMTEEGRMGNLGSPIDNLSEDDEEEAVESYD